MRSDWCRYGIPPFDLCIPWVMVRDVLAPHRGRFALAQAIEAEGVPMLNRCAAIHLSSDKLASHLRWASASLPQPDTWLLDDGDGVRFDEPMVLKPALSWGGKDVHRVSSMREAEEIAHGWASPAILQEEIEEAVCIRVIATPSRAFTAAEKLAQHGELVAAIGQGAEARFIEPEPALRALACRMVEALGGGLMGLDVLRKPNGRLIALEANVPFGFNTANKTLHDEMVATAERVAAGDPA